MILGYVLQRRPSIFSEHVVLSNDQYGLWFYEVAQFETHSQQISASDNALQNQKTRLAYAYTYENFSSNNSKIIFLDSRNVHICKQTSSALKLRRKWRNFIHMHNLHNPDIMWSYIISYAWWNTN